MCLLLVDILFAVFAVELGIIDQLDLNGRVENSILSENVSHVGQSHHDQIFIFTKHVAGGARLALDHTPDMQIGDSCHASDFSNSFFDLVIVDRLWDTFHQDS